MEAKTEPSRSTRGARRWGIYAIGLLVALAGLFLAVGGAFLVARGGSWYFLVAGIFLLVSGVLVLRARPSGAWLYAVVYAATIVWALWDVGLAFWPLVSRLFAFGVIGLLLALAYPELVRSAGRRPARGAPAAVAAVLAVALAATAASAFFPKNVVPASETAAGPVPVPPGGGQKNWAAWAGTEQGTRFAALDQINRGNVQQLQVAWTAHTGDIPQSNGSGAEDQNTPLQIGDTLYVCTPYSKVLALDADTGEQRWKYDARARSPNWQRCRGLGYFEDAPAAAAPASAPGTGAAAADCRRRLFLPTIDARLIALDADTGKPCEGFGAHGTVDLSAGMGRITDGWYQQTSTPLVADRYVIVGGRVADNWSTDEPSGVVRAFDVHTGQLAWA
ncbi:MAG: Quinate/shikimate dehydrogenase (quinone) [Xylophilus sp.]|nr:hypothetical protein [Xylophilus sp.]KAF1047980.1 MAG: Quinate/shikimate dehydrogenase (quinone) [Xylophilus sp.]